MAELWNKKVKSIKQDEIKDVETEVNDLKSKITKLQGKNNICGIK